ncbi:DUF4365 domain-containing protein [Neisseriaceae bacterium JH1-16]|nr:DUF4365 domain-containing protein [Neisseriaceae bacterium JH1-16]
MQLPTRIRQHKAESDSYAILLYKLRNIGIFRNVTESDYGIDFEVEIVHGTNVTGTYFKAQVKSSENLKVRKKDGVPVVGGIKESTLYYWTELSYKSHVIAFAVDLKSEEIYVSRPLFWQATTLINGDKKSKSIEFLPPVGASEDQKVRDIMPGVLALAFALSPSIPDIIYSHKLALRYFGQFLSLYVDVFHYDVHCEIHDIDAFKTLLDACRVLLAEASEDDFDLGNHDKRFRYSFDYWVKNSGEWATDEVTNFSAQTPVRVLIPLLVRKLKKLRTIVFSGKYYWAYKDPTYLRLVYETKLPSDSTEETLRDWGYNFEQYQHEVIGFSLFKNLPVADLEKAGIK